MFKKKLKGLVEKMDFKIGDIVEDKNGIRGIIEDILEGEEYPIGVIFDDEKTTIWWVKENEIVKR